MTVLQPEGALACWWTTGGPKPGQVHPQRTGAHGVVLKRTEEWQKPRKKHGGAEEIH